MNITDLAELYQRQPKDGEPVRYTKAELLAIARDIGAGLTDSRTKLIHQAVIVFLEEALQ